MNRPTDWAYWMLYRLQVTINVHTWIGTPADDFVINQVWAYMNVGIS